MLPDTVCRAKCQSRGTSCNGQPGQSKEQASSGCQWGSCLQACVLLNEPGSAMTGNLAAVEGFCGQRGCSMGGFSQCEQCDHGAGPGVATPTSGTDPNCNDPAECLKGAHIFLS